MFTHECDSATVACNFKFLWENEGLLKVTRSNVHCKCSNIAETVKMESLIPHTANRKDGLSNSGNSDDLE